jgi:hypothetical protein
VNPRLRHLRDVRGPTAKVFFNIKKFKCNRKCGRAVGPHANLNAVGQGGLGDGVPRKIEMKKAP